ncbi:MAG TPA: ribonuclease P protein component [Phnomibacter sp.]|nr:ribonuclease P protein component [Phnomibacter sp.]
MSITGKHTLSKAEKLKSRKQIDELFASGKGFTAYPVKVMYKISGIANNQPEETGEPVPEANIALPTKAAVQIGVTASSRNFKHSVDRNRIKRLLREAYRHQKHELLQLVESKGFQLSLFFIYLDKTLPDFAMLDDKMRYCLKRVRKILEEQP